VTTPAGGPQGLDGGAAENSRRFIVETVLTLVVVWLVLLSLVLSGMWVLGKFK